MVAKFYSEVAKLPCITDQEMGSAMQQLSAQQSDEFDTVLALKELYIYITKYREPVSMSMSEFFRLLSVIFSDSLRTGKR